MLLASHTFVNSREDEICGPSLASEPWLKSEQANINTTEKNEVDRDWFKSEIRNVEPSLQQGNPEPLQTESPLTASAQIIQAFDKMARSVLERYDLDASGTIASFEQMEQVALNLLCKLEIQLQQNLSMKQGLVRALERFVSHRPPISKESPVTAEQFIDWFCQEFDVTTSRRLHKLGLDNPKSPT